MAPQPLPFPGFTPISDRVYLRDPYEQSKPPQAHEPTTIAIFGWGDGLPRHVVKYVDSYQKLFPCSRIVVVLSSTLQASIQPLESRIAAMAPVIDIVFPSPTGCSNREERVLFHAMSNTGAVFLAATLAAYQKHHGSNRTVPYTLLVCDSTPGSLDFATQGHRWSRAMAVGTSKHFPWPFAITQALWYSILWANWTLEWLRGTEPSGVWANRVINDLAISPIDSNRLYLYSKEDEIIGWEDLVQAVAQIRRLGYRADLEMFEGSPHVGHMRLHPQQYWNRILSAWEETQLKVET